jgi:hypothetical protein
VKTNEAFIFRVIDYDHKKKEYTLKNDKTGEVKTISKADYEFYITDDSTGKHHGRKLDR